MSHSASAHFLTSFLVSSALSTAALAGPAGGVVTAGDASISSGDKLTEIHQTSNRAVIDWRSFDINRDETTRFHQPDSTSITLNRVNDIHPSQIDGKLEANGNLIIINPNGVMFGDSAQVDVNSLVATSADIDNDAFMAGSLSFDRPGQADAKIINKGTITAKDAGLVGLVAPQVENHGVIVARGGRVHLASGDTMTLDLYGDGLMEVAVSDAVTQQLVSNKGMIQAEGGTVALTAAAGRHVIDSLVENSGVITTSGFTRDGGTIILTAAGDGSRAGAGGVLHAAGADAGLAGGTIEVTAETVLVESGANLDVSGHAGGGVIHIGGGYQGKGELANATTTIVQTDALLSATGADSGDGGEVIVWADDYTFFGGLADVRAGVLRGNGGFTETSGKNILQVTGSVLAGAVFGEAGTWLLDPADITITAADNNITTTPGWAGAVDITASGTGSTIAVSTITDVLDGGSNVTIQTTNDGFAGNGDIIVNTDITSAGNGDLELDAYHDIIINNAIDIGGALLLTAGNALSSSQTIDAAGALRLTADHIDLAATATTGQHLFFEVSDDGTLGIGDNATGMDNTISGRTMNNLVTGWGI
jgi:filamentous hemagglutinin family protein